MTLDDARRLDAALDAQQRAITVSVLQLANGPESIEARVEMWLEQNPPNQPPTP